MHKGPILVVDDDLGVREALSDVLSDQGFVVHCVDSGVEALHYLATHPLPSVMIADWNMNPMNGAELLEALHSNEAWADIPVLLLTADRRVQSIWQHTSAAAFLGKPVNLDVLIDYLLKHCT